MLFWLGRSSRARAIQNRRCALSPALCGPAVLAKVKFCGMTRPDDAALAAEIGASYVGVVFADGPRRVSQSQARKILDAGGGGGKRVGVFGTNEPDEIQRASEEARLDIVQLHADPSTDDVKSIRAK